MQSVRRGSAHVITLTGDLDLATTPQVEDEPISAEGPAGTASCHDRRRRAIA